MRRLRPAVDRRTQAKPVVRDLEESCRDIGPTLAAMAPVERREPLTALVGRAWRAGNGTIRAEGAVDFRVWIDAEAPRLQAPRLDRPPPG